MGFAAATLVPLIVAISFAAGLNVYATVAAVGLLGRFGVFPLPPELQLLSSDWVIAASSVLFLVELFADKIPVFDLLWNALQTFVRIPVAALLAYGTASHLSLPLQIACAALGGLIALAAHGGKTAARAVVTASPEPFSNIALSAGEDALAVSLVWFAAHHPVLAALFVGGLLAVMALLARALFGALARRFHPKRLRPGMTDLR